MNVLSNYLVKSIFTLFLFVSFISFSWGQNFGGGISVGMNASQVDGDAASGFNQAGLHIGGFVNYEFSNKLFLQPEIIFEQLGSSFQGFIFVKTTHVSMPVVLTANIPLEIGNATQAIEVHAGPVIGLLMRARNDNRDDISADLKRFDSRIVGGIAYRFTPGFSFMVRYGYSIGSFIKTNAPTGAILLVPGRTGLAHHYVNFALRVHLSG